jgi:hypothetical protein
VETGFSGKQRLIQPVRPESFGCAQESLAEGHFNGLILFD